MKRSIILILVLLISLISIHFSLAKKEKVFKIQANGQPIVYLGEKIDPKSKKAVQGFAFVHYAKNQKVGKGGKNICYAYLTNGAKWKNIEPWLFNASNLSNLDQEQLFNILTNSINKWEIAAGTSEGHPIDILGNGYLTDQTLSADLNSPDGQNEIYFADVSEPGAIAVTIVWGTFSAPISQRELIEWDQVYDDVDYPWSLIGETDKMDFENIATHELGHSVGMDDLYQNNCSEETMYGYSNYGEIKKRDLNTGDIIGVDKLYH